MANSTVSHDLALDYTITTACTLTSVSLSDGQCEVVSFVELSHGTGALHGNHSPIGGFHNDVIVHSHDYHILVLEPITGIES